MAAAALVLLLAGVSKYLLDLRRERSAVLDDQGGMAAALEARNTALELHRWLVEQSPERVDWRNGLAVDHLQLGNLYSQPGERDRARQSLLAGREITAGLVELCRRHGLLAPASNAG